MARSGVTALSLAVMLALLEFGSCIRCYQCSSQKDPGCADATPPRSYVVDCGTQDSVNFNRLYLGSILRDFTDGTLGASRFCHKIVMQSGTVARTCLEGDAHNLGLSCNIIENTAKLARDPNALIKHCSVCETDLCNGAGSIAVSLPLAGLALLASYFYASQ